MKRSKLYIFIAVMTAISLFSTAALCNQHGVKAEEEKTGAEEESEGEKTAPTIELEIYEGPTYSTAGDVRCYRKCWIL